MHVVAPQAVSDELAPLADRGLIAVRAQLGETVWDTSLLPRGDGRHFIPLKAAVRDAHGIDVGDEVTLTIAPRER